ncbi:MAG: hypothetical protein ABW252_13175 [Polyangiales bacterium]
MSTTPGAERAASDSAQAETTCRPMVMVASPRLVLGLQLTPVLGILGTLALYWSRGWRDGLFLLGVLLMLGALGGFRVLRARLVDRVERQLVLHGLQASRARARAHSDVDRLLRVGRAG